ncbi:hypothetical protein Moror_17056 [Moniliophthora roreri MCA 2997]|uniref:Uncharacterized protein n=2 Tax=Moniliophthora roreri TaxID=221103 RepID=V2X7T5_MONRO|nr:hypothetical protein Moror_17056 [Moniliophthora roreri MCA 2997]
MAKKIRFKSHAQRHLETLPHPSPSTLRLLIAMITGLPLMGVSELAQSAITLSSRRLIDMNMVMQLMSAFSSFMVFYTSIIFTIFSVIFLAQFTLALLKTITVLFFSGYPKQRLLSKMRAVRRQLPVPIRAEPTAPQAALPPESTFSSLQSPELAQASSSRSANRHARSRSVRPLLDMPPSTGMPSSIHSIPLPSSGRPIVKTKVTAGKVTVDMERRRASGCINNLYFRVRLPSEYSIQSHLDIYEPRVESSRYKVFCRGSVVDSNANDTALWVVHPLIKGTIALRFDFDKSDVLELFPELNELTGTSRIRIPNVFQTLTDMINSLAGKSELPMEEVSGVSEVMLEYDASDRYRSFLEPDGDWVPIPARTLHDLTKAESKDLRCPTDDNGQREMIPKEERLLMIPVPRRFIFKAESGFDDIPLALCDINKLPFTELTHVSLENVQISFDDCRKLISRCPNLQTLRLLGPHIGGGGAGQDLFGAVDIGLKVPTCLKRLEIRGSNYNVWTLIRGLLLQDTVLILKLSTLGLDKLNPTDIIRTLQNVSSFLIPNNVRSHPNVEKIVVALKQVKRDRIVKSYQDNDM